MLGDYFFFSFLPSFFIVIIYAVSTTASTFITFSIYKALNTIAPHQFFQSFPHRNRDRRNFSNKGKIFSKEKNLDSIEEHISFWF
ncbi:hypothetical protein ERO13_D08G010750v2 [Gossypium hirsutum]|uniref:Uncharacterized protein n=1 Tax=Gossypium barbadense TaxID=3634 RepID=A0A5J5QA42_GOSBA|nr:hypothetical protein ES319_D08G003600v1 [Gossypium barbadense]KAG4132091.1 hypothetical protein ERO13_D08G010750v2 [Gossypium hirsutum]